MNALGNENGQTRCIVYFFIEKIFKPFRAELLPFCGDKLCGRC